MKLDSITYDPELKPGARNAIDDPLQCLVIRLITAMCGHVVSNSSRSPVA